MIARRLAPATLVAAAVLVLFAQERLGTLAGSVSDVTGAVIPGATVSIWPLAGSESERVSAMAGPTGGYLIRELKPQRYWLQIESEGFKSHKQEVELKPGQTLRVDVVLEIGELAETVEVTASPPMFSTSSTMIGPGSGGGIGGGVFRIGPKSRNYAQVIPGWNTEGYDHIDEGGFKNLATDPLSTFSIDVDTASYANVRRFISDGQLPPADAVRIEELINYFRYAYPAPKKEMPFSVDSEITRAPWNSDHKLVRIGLQSKPVSTINLPANNLVFLLDVSGSMDSPDKLPLLKKAFRMLTHELRQKDRVAIVVYAGASGLVLPSTRGSKKHTILECLDRLRAGGSTAGASGIQLAYQTARENFRKGGNNRVILATDGDFNVGVSSDGELTRLIEKEREGGVFLTVLGFGTRNVKDSKMEKLADKGNGSYAYIDSELEARRVLVEQIGATLLTVAKDVKLQVEFNPAKVRSYRLIGYENRVLATKDFDDDKKDAGEMGAGHAVTALYEVMPRRGRGKPSEGGPLRYQVSSLNEQAQSNELFTVKVRYKAPKSNKSELSVWPVNDQVREITASSAPTRWAAAVAQFGMLLRGSQYVGESTFQDVFDLARTTIGEDADGSRTEFLHLVKTAQRLSSAP